MCFNSRIKPVVTTNSTISEPCPQLPTERGKSHMKVEMMATLVRMFREMGKK